MIRKMVENFFVLSKVHLRERFLTEIIAVECVFSLFEMKLLQLKMKNTYNTGNEPINRLAFEIHQWLITTF